MNLDSFITRGMNWVRTRALLRLNFRDKAQKFLSREEVIDYILFLVLSILPFLWYGSDLILSGYFADMIEPLDAFMRSFFVWDSRTHLGYPYFQSAANLFPRHTFSIVFSVIGTLINQKDLLWVVNRLWLVLFFFLPAVSMYYLMSVITPKPNRVGKLIASLAYMYALPNILYTHGVSLDMLQTYGIIPLMLGFFIRGMNTLNYVRYALLLAFASLIMGGLNPPLIAINLLIIIVYFLYDVITERTHVLQKIKFSIYSLILFILFNAHVIISSISFVTQAYVSSYMLSENVRFISSTTSYLETFRLLGHWGFYTGYKGIPFFSFAPQYVPFTSPPNPILIFTTLLIPVIASISLLTRSKDKYVLFFGILIILIMPIATGTNWSNPAGPLILWLFENVPLFWVFRNVNKFVSPLSFAFSVLIGFTANELWPT